MSFAEDQLEPKTTGPRAMFTQRKTRGKISFLKSCDLKGLVIYLLKLHLQPLISIEMDKK